MSLPRLRPKDFIWTLATLLIHSIDLTCKENQFTSLE